MNFFSILDKGKNLFRLQIIRTALEAHQPSILWISGVFYRFKSTER